MKEERTLELVLKEDEGELFHDGQRRANEDFAAGTYSKTVHQYAADDVAAGYSYEWNRLKNPPPARQDGETPDTIISAIDCLRQIVELSNINEATRRIIKEVGSRLLPCIGMERELSDKQAEVEQLRKESNDWRTKFLTQRDEANIKTWIWMGDGEDHPESLACPVIMSADQLREFVSCQAELESLKAAQGWRPISEHPQDGTEFHAWDGEEIFYRLYRSMDHGELIWRQAWFSPDLPCTRYEDFPQELADKLTHWMPLPTPPVERSVDGE